MRHLKKGKKLHRKKDQRQALIKTMAYNLIIKEKITTTKAKAKIIQPFVEKLITKAKKQNLSSLRYIKSQLPQKAANKIYYELSERYKNRNGGYTRIIPTEKYRIKDAANLVILELIK